MKTNDPDPVAAPAWLTHHSPASPLVIHVYMVQPLAKSEQAMAAADVGDRDAHQPHGRGGGRCQQGLRPSRVSKGRQRPGGIGCRALEPAAAGCVPAVPAARWRVRRTPAAGARGRRGIQ